jgi:hypothetical protein
MKETKEESKLIPQTPPTPPTHPLRTDFETASIELRDALVDRGIAFTARSSRTGLHIHRTGRIYQSFSLEGGPRDLHLTVFPRPRPGQVGRPEHCWELMMSIDVVVRWDEERPNRAQDLHAVPAAQIRDLGFNLEDEDHDHIPGDPESYWSSEWTRFVFSVEEAANIVMALMEVDTCQYPDGDAWMQTLVPLSTDQVEHLIALANPPDGRTVCPVVMATGDYYWIHPVTPGGSVRLVGPGGELAASVSQSLHWYTCTLSGEPLARGQSVSLLEAMRTAERMARAFGATRKKEPTCQ